MRSCLHCVPRLTSPEGDRVVCSPGPRCDRVCLTFTRHNVFLTRQRWLATRHSRPACGVYAFDDGRHATTTHCSPEGDVRAVLVKPGEATPNSKARQETFSHMSSRDLRRACRNQVGLTPHRRLVTSFTPTASGAAVLGDRRAHW